MVMSTDTPRHSREDAVVVDAQAVVPDRERHGPLHARCVEWVGRVGVDGRVGRQDDRGLVQIVTERDDAGPELAHDEDGIEAALVYAEAGVPTFRGEDGLWKNHSPEELATPQAFRRDPRTARRKGW